MVYKPCVISFPLLAEYVLVLFVLFPFSSEFFCTLHYTRVTYPELHDMESPAQK